MTINSKKNVKKIRNFIILVGKRNYSVRNNQETAKQGQF